VFCKEPLINTVKYMSGFRYGLDSGFKLHNIINEPDKKVLHHNNKRHLPSFEGNL
jgi:hypothetical protein